MRKIFSLSIAAYCLLLNQNLNAQACGNCKETPSVASYDFDIQATQPENDADVQSWKQLFWLARHTNGYLFQQNKNCVRFIQPAYNDRTKKIITKEGIEIEPLINSSEIMKVGEVVANIPGSGAVAYGEYITTGNVTRSGDDYMLHVEIQQACSRKKVTSADVPFRFSSDSKYMEGIAHQAATKLTPVIDKIKEFELRERIDRKDFALGGNQMELIKILPAKKGLLPGETTDFTVLLKDCDGLALAGREIVFTDSKNELKIPGTLGGIVTPAKVITDASGKASAKFKMTAGKGQPAIINAHSISGTSKNCVNAFLGSAKVDALQAYKVELEFSLTGSEGSGIGIIPGSAGITGSYGKTYQVNYSLTAFYYPPPGQNLLQQISLMPEETNDEDDVEIEPLVDEDEKVEIEPLVPSKEKIEIPPLIYHEKGYGVDHSKKTKAGIVHFYYSGNSELNSWDRTVGFGTQPIKVENIQSDKPATPVISMTFKNNELTYFDGNLEFPQDKKGRLPMGGSIGIMKDDPKYYPVKPKKITDPNSPYKWEYTINYKKEDAQSINVFGIAKGEGKVAEISTVRIYSAY